MKNRNLKHSDNWATPEAFYDALDAEFHFDFDPCPLHADFNGLATPWGKRNFINPPYSRKLKEEFVIKAVRESQGGGIVRHAATRFHEHRPIPRLDQTSCKGDSLRAWPRCLQGYKYQRRLCRGSKADARFDGSDI